MIFLKGCSHLGIERSCTGGVMVVDPDQPTGLTNDKVYIGPSLKQYSGGYRQDWYIPNRPDPLLIQLYELEEPCTF